MSEEERPGETNHTKSAPPLEHITYFKRFLHHDMVGSGVLLFAAFLAVVAANIGFSEQYHHFWESKLGISWGEDGGFAKSFHHWVNDGLMAIFFFLVGLEIKRELLVGELASVRKAILPAVAAIGGMIVPALIYYVINRGEVSEAGWGIPMATDIAFAAGCIAILKKWVPPSLMIFLVALAIVDDMGAVAVIAIFYTDQIAFGPLVLGSGLIILSFCLGLYGVRSTVPYVIFGAIIWLAFLQSGVHATIAGILLAFSIPTKAAYRTHLFHDRMVELLHKFTHAEEHWDDHVDDEKKDLMVNHKQQGLIRHMNTECHHVEAPLQRIEHNLEPFCVFLIMPIFAFANAGVHVDMSHVGEVLTEPTALGIILGLFVGKPLGIFLASFIAVKLGLASLPSGVTWSHIIGVGFLAGIGFTMSLFINELAFLGVPPEAAEGLVAEGKIAIFLASILSAVVGVVFLKMTDTTLNKFKGGGVVDE
jgi:NhaA family Na+:H+ antiporter